MRIFQPSDGDPCAQSIPLEPCCAQTRAGVTMAQPGTRFGVVALCCWIFFGEEALESLEAGTCKKVRMFCQGSQDGRRACLVVRWMRERILGASASLQQDAQLVFQKTGVGISCFASIQIISVVVAPAWTEEGGIWPRSSFPSYFPLAAWATDLQTAVRRAEIISWQDQMR